MRFLVFSLVFLSSLYAFNFNISNSITSNAKTVYIEFEKEKDVKYKHLVIGERVYSILKHPSDRSKMYALIPISYYQKPSDLKVEIVYVKNTKESVKNIFLKVKKANYKKEKIQVQKSKVNPKSTKVKQRIASEYKEAMSIYAKTTQESYITSKFIVPMESKITSDFGKARVYNNTLNGYHSGTDFRAKIGTPIVASNDGIVVLAKQRFYAGGTVILNHGQGIYTCYYHMSSFKVKKGDRVHKSQVLGLSGDTGRVTGAHLHFSVRVGGLQVDPLQFIQLANKNLF